MKLAIGAGERSGKLVAELTDVSRSPSANEPIVKDLDLIVSRGDRIGLIGPNGAGKTTLLKLILGTLAPDSGSVRLGTNVAARLLRPDARGARPGEDRRRDHQPRLGLGRGRRRRGSTS